MPRHDLMESEAERQFRELEMPTMGKIPGTQQEQKKERQHSSEHMSYVTFMVIALFSMALGGIFNAYIFHTYFTILGISFIGIVSPLVIYIVLFFSLYARMSKAKRLEPNTYVFVFLSINSMNFVIGVFMATFGGIYGLFAGGIVGALMGAFIAMMKLEEWQIL